MAPLDPNEIEFEFYVRGPGGLRATYDARGGMLMGKVFKDYCEKFTLPFHNTVFYYKAKEISPLDTPNGIGLKDGEEIWADRRYLFA